MIEFLISVASGIGIGFATESLAWGIVAFFVTSVIMTIWVMSTTVSLAVQWAKDNAYRSTTTLPDGSKRHEFQDGGVVIVSPKGNIKTVIPTPMTEAPGALL